MAKEPWLAVFLSGLLPGAGQIYASNKPKGIVFIIVWFSFSLILAVGFLLFLTADNASFSQFYGLAGLIALISTIPFSIYNLFDAHKIAKRYNEAHNLSLEAVTKKSWLAVFLSDILPGIGQFYNKQVLKGIAFLIVTVILIIVCEIYYPFSLLLIPWCLFVLKDSFDSAERINGSGRKFIKQGTKFAKIFVILMITINVIPFNDIAKAHFVQAFKFPSGSMLPTLKIGDHILVDKRSNTVKSIKKGDIIVFKYPVDPERDFAKRVIAVGGDTLESKDKVIYINGRVLDEKYTQHVDSNIMPAESDRRDNFGPIKVPEGNYFVMGDNRDQSYDSRFWGFVSKDAIKGKVVKIYWSWDPANSHPRWERIGERIY